MRAGARDLVVVPRLPLPLLRLLLAWHPLSVNIVGYG